jgi:membrane-bound lytic murein transglycosylase B
MACRRGSSPASGGWNRASAASPGTRPVVAALATLAWDPRRSTFFRGELLDALEIVNRGDIELARLRGSWAGAMGQPQFMPSSYLKFAEDWDGDGRRDVWSDEADIFASIANYLKGNGWRLTKPGDARSPSAVRRRAGLRAASRGAAAAAAPGAT